MHAAHLADHVCVVAPLAEDVGNGNLALGQAEDGLWAKVGEDAVAGVVPARGRGGGGGVFMRRGVQKSAVIVVGGRICVSKEPKAGITRRADKTRGVRAVAVKKALVGTVSYLPVRRPARAGVQTLAAE